MSGIKLPRSSPEAQGVSSAAILSFLKRAGEEKHEMHSFMLLKSGCVISECWWRPYAPTVRHQLFSLSKSFTSIGVGMAADDGLLTTDTLVADIFKDEMGELSAGVDEKIKKMSVKNLLTMGTGMGYENWQFEGEKPNNIKAFLSSHIKNEPGSAFFYHTQATYMLSAIVTRLTGKKLVDFLKPRLFDPLGIDPVWEEDNLGVNFGGFGLNITTEDIAKFGQFILQKGVWDGKRLVSEKWIDEATSKQISNGDDPGSDWAQGYGYQFWRCVPDGVFRGDGAFGQYCIVMPECECVIAITSNVDMQKLLRLIWADLLPALNAAEKPQTPEQNEKPQTPEPIANPQTPAPIVKQTPEQIAKPQMSADGAAQDLAAYCAGLSHLAVNADAQAYPTFRGRYFPKSAVPDRLEPLKGAVDVCFENGECTLALFADKRKAASIIWNFRHGEWTFGVAPHFNTEGYFNKSCAYGEWAENTFSASVWYYETPMKHNISLSFNEDRTELSVKIELFGFGAETLVLEFTNN